MRAADDMKQRAQMLERAGRIQSEIDRMSRRARSLIANVRRIIHDIDTVHRPQDSERAAYHSHHGFRHGLAKMDNYTPGEERA